MKLYNYEKRVLKTVFLKLFSAEIPFRKLLSLYRYMCREESEAGTYLKLKKEKETSCDNLNLSSIDIPFESNDLYDGGEFIVWHSDNFDCIVIEGYSYENRWLEPDSLISIV